VYLQVHTNANAHSQERCHFQTSHGSSCPTPILKCHFNVHKV